jgi:hypothetical protein
MKKINLCLLFLLTSCITIYAQRQYGEILPMQTMCPCETAKFFRSRQDIQMTINPFNMSRNCYIPLAVPVSSEGGYFFKKRKKKNKVSYPKGSHIIQF